MRLNLFFSHLFFSGLLDLYETTFNESYLAWAIDLQDQQNKLFYDDEGGGGFFNVGKNAENILVRLKDGKHFPSYRIYCTHLSY